MSRRIHVRASPLWQLVRHGWDEFLASYESKYRQSLGPLHPAATATVESFLQCGDLASGFTRLQCPDCGHERLLAFTCKGRHFCPSCHPGAGVFEGSDRWLEIGVVTTGGGAFTTLAPRQPLTPTPYAIRAVEAGYAGTATTAGSFTGPLAGEVTGPQAATTVAQVGGESAANVATGAAAANAATNPHFPALRSDPMALSGASRRKQIPRSKQSHPRA